MTGLYSTKTRFFGLTVAAALVLSATVFQSARDVHAYDKGDLVSEQVKKDAHAPMVITMGKADVISLPSGISDVLVANPTIVDVQAIQSNKLYIVGLNIGDTNIIVLDSAGNVVQKLNVHVTYDLDAIQSLVGRLFPSENVTVSAIHDQILLTGTVSNPEAAGRIANLVGHYVSDLQDTTGKSIDEIVSNLMEVQGEQQVMLKVKVLEASRSVLKELGVDANANDGNELSTTELFDQSTPSSTRGDINALMFGGLNGLALSQEAAGAANIFLDSGIRGIGQIGVFLKALEEENLINVLAEPNLTAVSGQQAGFLAGGEFPIPTGRDQYGNITVEYKKFGVSLNFKPVVLSDKRINLQLNTEVSSLDNNNTVTLSGVVVPGLDIRRAETTIEMPSGGSLMIAGLLQSEAAQGLTGLPGIKNTPVLGDLMSSDSFRREETELVVIITSYLVEPYSDQNDADRKTKEHSALSKIFLNNVRRKVNPDEEDVLSTSEPFGYILN